MAFKEYATRGIRGISAWVIYALVGILLAACGEKTRYTPPPPPAVTVAQPVRRLVTDNLDLTGNTQAVKTVQLQARVAGYLEKIFFQDGQSVKEGQLLFLIQQNTYQDNLRQAEAAIELQKVQLEYAQTQLTRYSNLLQQKAAAQTDVDNWRYQRDSAQANLLSAQAKRDLAKLDFGYTEVRAPFDGRIDRRLKDVGNLVGSAENTVLAEINQIDPIYVYFNISDADLARLVGKAHWTPGQVPDLKWPVFMGHLNEKDYPHKGHLDFASISLTPTTGTLLLRGIFSNPNGKILPGLYTRVRVPVEKKTALLVPEVAVSNDQQGSHVLIVSEKNVVERRGVKTGPSVDNFSVIEEGLTGEESVVIRGVQKAIPGRQVTPERENLPSTAGSSQSPRQPKVKP
jgi:RND family efflux transporter MFP subunit